MSEESIEAVHAERDQLAKNLANRTAQLDSVTREFEQFTHSISHDLRAPLRALEGFANILIEDYAGKLDADGKRCIEVLASSAHKASLLIEDLLALSRACRRPFHPVAVNLGEMMARKVAEAQAEGAKAKFRLEPLPEVWADPDLLGMILEQLIGNAVKFSSRQAEPVVEVGGEAEAQQTVFHVRDNGVGFDPKHGSRLFGVFQRLHVDQEFEGRGVGLALVQRLVNRHGGRVWAEANVNEGATFFVALPAREK